MKGSQYERELRGILEGDKKILSKVTKSCTTIEKESYLQIIEKPFAVIRAAGSLGVDLVAVRGDISFLVEIKSSSSPTLHFSQMAGKPQQQALTMKILCQKTKTLPIYAFRLKNIRGDAWRFFTLDISDLSGKTSIIQKRLPKLDQSKNNNYIMHWDNGMQLSNFIRYLTQ
jgi:Holliday junction resolvase